jgi:hypothetical protein
MKNYLVLAIKFLKPNAEFVITDDDYSTIVWHVLEGDAPTEKEINDAIKAVKAEEIKTAKANATAKSALLERLGITEDEAKLLLA